jgi:hypothetical protein
MSFNNKYLKWGIYSFYMLSALLMIWLLLWLGMSLLTEAMVSSERNPFFMFLVIFSGIFTGGIVPSSLFYKVWGGERVDLIKTSLAALIFAIPGSALIFAISLALPDLGRDIEQLDQPGFYSPYQLVLTVILVMAYMSLSLIWNRLCSSLGPEEILAKIWAFCIR